MDNGFHRIDHNAMEGFLADALIDAWLKNQKFIIIKDLPHTLDYIHRLNLDLQIYQCNCLPSMWVYECAMLGWQFTTDTTTSWVLTRGRDCDWREVSGVRPGTITVVITDTDWSLWPDHPRVIDSRDNDNQQQPILSQQLAESGAGQGLTNLII